MNLFQGDYHPARQQEVIDTSHLSTDSKVFARREPAWKFGTGNLAFDIKSL